MIPFSVEFPDLRFLYSPCGRATGHNSQEPRYKIHVKRAPEPWAGLSLASLPHARLALCLLTVEEIHSIWMGIYAAGNRRRHRRHDTRFKIHGKRASKPWAGSLISLP